ncbi:MAG: hypothetical protein FP813_09190 [Desulfurivibrio sp.]|nr:hypothetical protein [Desulfurivibrio sp.]MBU4033495.1 YkgJ family cysteine cluster protein [Pseudomonadota bacterium]MBU4118343.1 YkgJ family cysteine cluster protein [Pseudomonadota bacterium]
MGLIENNNPESFPQEFGVGIPIAPQEKFVNRVYSLVDEAIACELDRLRREEGVVPSCKSGCSHCCRYHILTNIAEAHTLAQYIRREFSEEQIRNLRDRTQHWHEWDDSKPGRHPFSPSGEGAIHSTSFDHSCPFDVNGTCRVYPVRPIVCRAHFVSSSPRFCATVNDPESTEDAPVVLVSVVEATRPFTTEIRNYIENTGMEFSRSQMLLPQWLAHEMGWDFGIVP